MLTFSSSPSSSSTSPAPRGRKDGATAGTAKGASSSATAGSAAANGGGQLPCPFERVGCPFTCSQPQKLIEHTNGHKDAYDPDLACDVDAGQCFRAEPT